MTTVGKIKAHDSIMGIQEGRISVQVCGRTRKSCISEISGVPFDPKRDHTLDIDTPFLLP